ncbi:cell division protein ZipA [Shewanella waksmanii]|uniref:cell division protein ZipA n=1 Tax=Shewanella waksmanii TaxID=213783 RepID=UPI0004909B66|nr:cell division protein ZipA [Shewanella waksmanii]
MENLQLVLFVLGAIAIIAVLVHGFWSIRKQQPKSLKENPMSGLYTDKPKDADGFDADGIGEVRVKKASEENTDSEQYQQVTPSKATSSSHNGQMSPQEPVLSAIDDVEDEPEVDFSLSNQPTTKAPKAKQEPQLTASSDAAAENVQMDLGLAPEPAPAQPSLFEAEPVAEPQIEQASAIEEEIDAPLPEPEDVLVLHVVANEGELNGAELLPSLLALNFKFGDMNIFHRHEDNAGTGKVLFSLANMVKPGVFNPDDMEQFSTHGVVLFMTLPCYGEPLMNFSIMLNSAHQLADDLGGKLLDGGREEWSEATKQNYLQRIRQHTA